VNGVAPTFCDGECVRYARHDASRLHVQSEYFPTPGCVLPDVGSVSLSPGDWLRWIKSSLRQFFEATGLDYLSSCCGRTTGALPGSKSCGDQDGMASSYDPWRVHQTPGKICSPAQ